MRRVLRWGLMALLLGLAALDADQTQPTMPARRTPSRRAPPWTPWCRLWAAGLAQHEEPGTGGTGRGLLPRQARRRNHEYFEFHQWPDHDRIEYTKHRDVVQFYVGRTGEEVTYKGKAALPQEQVDDFCAAATTPSKLSSRVWLNDPRTILIYEGQRLAERHLPTR
jgi:hypothetical protein